jgi:phosphate:Na+ symporter
MNQTTLTLAGLGLFFTGLHHLATSMQAISSGKMRLFLSKITASPFTCATTGSLLGIITQSSAASVFVCIGLLNSGALPFNCVLSLVCWSSVGTSLLVFLAAIDVQLAGLYLVGLVGVAHLFNAGNYMGSKHIVAFLFSFGILLLGLGMIKEAGIGLSQSESVKTFIGFASEASAIGFLIGTMIALITRSSASVSMLAVTLNIAGILPFHDAVTIVFGASIGSGLSVVLATSHMPGNLRQLAIYQCLVKIVGVTVLLPFFWLDQGWIKTTLSPFLNSLSIGTWIALIYFLLQIMGAITASILNSKLLLLVNWLCPITTDERVFEPLYIYSEAAVDADMAIILATREQDRLLMALPEYLDTIRVETEVTSNKIPLDVRHSAACHLGEKIRLFMEETALQNQSETAIERIFALQSLNEAIISLQNSLANFVDTLQSTQTSETGWTASMVEGLHLVLIMLSDALANGETDNRDLLLTLTSDRSKLMEKIRDSMLSEKSGNITERQALFVSTGIFERIIWLVRQIVLSKLPDKNIASNPDFEPISTRHF